MFYQSAHRNFDNNISTGLTIAITCTATLAVIGYEFSFVTEVNQSVDVLIRQKNHATATTTVTTEVCNERFAVWGGVIGAWGDYNGDGVSDLAVYHAAGGRWYIRDLAGTVITNGLTAFSPPSARNAKGE